MKKMNMVIHTVSLHVVCLLYNSNSSINGAFSLKTGLHKAVFHGEMFNQRYQFVQGHSCNHNKRQDWFDVKMEITLKNGKFYIHSLDLCSFIISYTFLHSARIENKNMFNFCVKFYITSFTLILLCFTWEKTLFLTHTEDIPNLQ